MVYLIFTAHLFKLPGYEPWKMPLSMVTQAKKPISRRELARRLAHAILRFCVRLFLGVL